MARIDMHPPPEPIYDELLKPSAHMPGLPFYDRPYKFGEFYYCPDDNRVYYRNNEGYTEQIVGDEQIEAAKRRLPECRVALAS